ncbi:MAG: hypothetical protein AAF502_08970 [Bacteroidota bacterium]
MRRSVLLALSFLIGIPCLLAQETPIGIGQWRSHLPYKKASTVTQSSEKIYYGTLESLVSIDKQDFSTELFNKVSGLNDAGVQVVRYNPVNETLIIVYNNSNIDFLKDGKITNFNLIKETNSVTGDKSINHIFFDDEAAFFSAAFGIVKLDMVETEIRYTTFTNDGVNAVTKYNGNLYASMDDGIYYIAANNPEIVIKDFNNWTLVDQTDGLPSAYYSHSLAVLDGKLYVDVNDSVYVFDGNNWTFLFYRDNFYNRYMAAGSDKIVISTPCYNCADQLTYLYPDGSAEHFDEGNLVGAIGESIEDEQGNVWVADTFRGMARITPSDLIEEYDINGPFSRNVGDISIKNNEVWVASILLKPQWGFKTASDGFWSFSNNQWEIFRPFEIPELNGYWDMNTIEVNDADNHVFIGSYKLGLIEYFEGEITLYNADNSGLQPHANDGSSTRVSGMVFDDAGNLWVSNFGAVSPIVVRTTEGEWHSMGSSANFTQPTEVVVDRNNFKWFAGGNADKGVLVYDSGQDITNTNDDRWVTLRPNNSILVTDDVRSVAVDLDGNVWVGTTVGPIVFECASQIFDGQCPGRRPVAREGAFDDYLLGTETINTIAIDGANRKWFGTNNGVFVLDADAEEEVLRFNTGNSPLFTNEVNKIEINGITGEVFFGTSGGMLSYRSDATDGNVAFSDVYAFPNPVRPDYAGPIAIKGLVRDADVKITDVSGTLVYETRAAGGQAVWDGNDYNGRRANSGVYLVFLTSRDGTKKLVTKILLVN